MRLLLFSFFICNFIYSQDNSIFLYKQFIDGQDTLNYRLLVPKDFEKSKKYPLHLFLHGYGEKGADNKLQLKYIAKLFTNKKNRSLYKSFGVFPQFPDGDSWTNREKVSSNKDMYYKFFENKKSTKSLSLVIKLMDSLVKTKNVNTERVYVTGLSNGGMGTFEMLYRRPDMFAAATPICGGAHPETAKLFAKKTPVWIFHGSEDNVVHPLYSVKMVEAIIEAGGTPKFTLYDNVNHDSWLNAFKDKDFFKWIYSKKKSY